MKFTLHNEYIITDMLPVGDKRMAMGISQKDGSFATWEVADGEYRQAHYFSDMDEAIGDLCSRTLDELRLKKQEHKKEQGRGR